MLRSEDIQEMLTKTPDFWEKWALIIFSGLLVLMIAGTWFIKYPDTIEADGLLIAQNAPKEIVTLQEGRVIRIFVQNNEQVKTGEMLAWIESTGNHSQVIELTRQLDSSLSLLGRGKIEAVSRLFTTHFEKLGELQIGYQQFIIALEQFNDYLVNGFFNKKKQLLESDVATLSKVNQSITQQLSLMEQDMHLAEESFKMNDTLYSQNVLSKEEFGQQKSLYLNKQLSIPRLNATLLSNENQLREKQKEIYQMEHDILQQKIIFEQALQTFKSATNDWIRKYILMSPIDGKVAFTMSIQENQFLEKGKLLGYVNPENTQFYARINLPQNNFGKVDTGLRVQLRFAAYPYQEFGFINGKLNYVSAIGTDSGFLGNVQIDRQLVTDRNIKIQYETGLKTRAIVIIKNTRLLERLYNGLVKATTINK